MFPGFVFVSPRQAVVSHSERQSTSSSRRSMQTQSGSLASILGSHVVRSHLCLHLCELRLRTRSHSRMRESALKRQREAGEQVALG